MLSYVYVNLDGTQRSILICENWYVFVSDVNPGLDS